MDHTPKAKNGRTIRVGGTENLWKTENLEFKYINFFSIILNHSKLFLELFLSNGLMDFVITNSPKEF